MTKFTLVRTASHPHDPYLQILDWIALESTEMAIHLHRRNEDRMKISEFEAWAETASHGEMLEIILKGGTCLFFCGEGA